MTELTLPIIAQTVGFGVFLWLGLYLLVRATRRTTLIIVSLIGLFTQALFFGSGVLTDTAPSATWFSLIQRLSWWSSVLPAAAWYHFSSLVARRALPRAAAGGPPRFTRRVVAVYTLAVLLGVLGGTTDLFVDYARPVQVGAVYAAGSGWAYPVVVAFLSLVAAGACLNLVQAYRATASARAPGGDEWLRQLRLLAVGAAFFFAGALWISTRKQWDLPISVLPGYLFLFVGLSALGFGVANFGLLLEGQNVKRDFFYSFTGISLLNLFYVALLVLTSRVSPPGVLALVALVTLTHTLFDVGRTVLDRLFFSATEQDARAEAREYATALGTAPVAASDLALATDDEAAAEIDLSAMPADNQKDFKALVRRAITGLKSPPKLAQSPLLGLSLVQQRVMAAAQDDNRLNRAAALRDLLIEHIEGLRPAATSAASTSDAWRFYNVLYVSYVHGLSRKGALAEARRLADARRRGGQPQPDELEQVLVWIADVDEDTFYKWQRRASDTIALVLWEENLKLVGAAQAHAVDDTQQPLVVS